MRNAQEIKTFSQWLIDVGDGKLGKGDDELSEIEIPSEFLITNSLILLKRLSTIHTQISSRCIRIRTFSSLELY